MPPGTPGEVGGSTSTALLGFLSLAKAARRGSSSFFSFTADGAMGPDAAVDGGGSTPDVDCFKACSASEPGAGGS